MEVSKVIYSKWMHDTIYCISLEAILKRLTKFWIAYKEGVKRLRDGRESSVAVQKYKDMVQQKKTLFDIFPGDIGRMQKCEIEWGVKMSPADKVYYEDQKTERKQYCDRAVDPVWYAAVMRKQRLKERSSEAKKNMQSMMKYKSLEEIEGFLEENGDILEMSPRKKDDDADIVFEKPQSKAEKRKNSEDSSTDSLPVQYRHVRDSERKVKEEVYRAVADLKGKGMSLNEATQAVVTVANRLFDREWKVQEKEKKRSDLRDSMPSFRSVQEAMVLMETQALSQTVDRMEEGREDGKMVTHSIDSTTKKAIGQFAAQGIHIGRDSAIPLPLINICGESTEDIALQVL